MIEELSPEESQKLLSEQCVARLGCVLKGGEPYVVPVNYLLKDGFILIHSLPGLKVEALRAKPKACIQVDDIESFFKWRSVIGFGEFEEITDAVEREEFLSEIMACFPKFNAGRDRHKTQRESAGRDGAVSDSYQSNYGND